MPTHNALLNLIAEKGQVTVAEYMEMALTHPEYGYYMRKDPLGTQGDFTTAPEISQVFGELIGAWLADQWRVMGKPECALAELGPGRGTLMSDILHATKHVAGFHDAVSIHLVEASPVLRQKQWQALSGKHPRIGWHHDISEIPDKPLLLVANEFFDALPVRQFIFDGEWKERTVFLPLEGGGLRWGSKLLEQSGPPPFPPPSRGRIFEYSPAAENIARAIGAHVKAHGGAALIVDYGYEGDARGDTLQAVRTHRYHDPLVEPGSADLTCHVDFGLLRNAAQESGAAVYGAVPQGLFLNTLGAGVRAAKLCEAVGDARRMSILSGIERLTSPEQMGDLFRALAIVHPSYPKPEGF